MPENGTYRLSGGRRPALWWAPPPTRHRRSGGIEPTRPRGGKGAPAGGTVGGKDGQHTEVGSRLHVTTTDSRTGQTGLRDGGGHRLASWTSGYATARSDAVCRGAGCGRTRTSGSVGSQGQQRPLVYPTTMRSRPAYIRVINRRRSRSIATHVASPESETTRRYRKGMTGRSISEDWVTLCVMRSDSVVWRLGRVCPSPRDRLPGRAFPALHSPDRGPPHPSSPGLGIVAETRGAVGHSRARGHTR